MDKLINSEVFMNNIEWNWINNSYYKEKNRNTDEKKNEEMSMKIIKWIFFL